MILASKSLRRKELIQRICKDVKIIPSGVDESLVAQKPVEYFAERLARAKRTRLPKNIRMSWLLVVIPLSSWMGKCWENLKINNMLLRC